MIFTMTYQANRHPRTHVGLQEFDNLQEAAAHALDRIKHASNDVTRVLIREGDAYPSDHVIWDSNAPNAYVQAEALLELDSVLAELTSLTQRVTNLRVTLKHLLKV